MLLLLPSVQACESWSVCLRSCECSCHHAGYFVTSIDFQLWLPYTDTSAPASDRPVSLRHASKAAVKRHVNLSGITLGMLLWPVRVVVYCLYCQFRRPRRAKGLWGVLLLPWALRAPSLCMSHQLGCGHASMRESVLSARLSRGIECRRCWPLLDTLPAQAYPSGPFVMFYFSTRGTRAAWGDTCAAGALGNQHECILSAVWA
jgi:hypothetical protein